MNPLPLPHRAIRGASFLSFWRSTVWILLTLFLVLAPARAAGPDDNYLAIYLMIQSADTLDKKGDVELAHAKYLEAQKQLLAFQQTNPNWERQIVSFRLSYLASKVSDTTPKAVEPDSNPAPAAKPANAAKAPSAATTQPVVKLLDAGSEPRSALRLHPTVGDKQTMILTMKMGMETTVAGKVVPVMDIPPIVMTLLAEVKNIATNGDITYELAYQDSTMETNATTNPMVTAAMKPALESIRGLSGTGKMNDRGLVQSLQMKLPANADPAMVQMMDHVKDSFSSSSTPFPTEDVGLGARWEYQTKIKSQGAILTQTITSELAKLDGDHVSLDNSLTQNAANQKIQSAEMPGLKVNLIKMNGHATGTSSIDLSRLLPMSATMDENMEMEMSVDVGQQKQNTAMKMTMNIVLESK